MPRAAYEGNLTHVKKNGDCPTETSTVRLTHDKSNAACSSNHAAASSLTTSTTSLSAVWLNIRPLIPPVSPCESRDTVTPVYRQLPASDNILTLSSRELVTTLGTLRISDLRRIASVTRTHSTFITMDGPSRTNGWGNVPQVRLTSESGHTTSPRGRSMSLPKCSFRRVRGHTTSVMG